MTLGARNSLNAERDLDARANGIVSSVHPLLPAMWLPVCCVVSCAYVYAIFGRFTYPYPLEWLEPDTPDVVSRIFSGLPIYCEPTYAYVPSMKAALYYYVVAAFSLVLGNGLLAGRLVSVLSSFGVCFIIWNFVRREGGSWAWAVFGVSFFLACYHISLDWYDIARLDSLFLLLTVAGAFALRFSQGAAGAAASGAAFAAAFFTKQAVLFVIIPTLLLYAFAAPKRVIVASSATAIFIAAGMVGLHFATDGWSTFYLIEVPRHAAITPDRIVGLWTADLLAPFSLALLSSIGLIAGTWTSDRGRALFYCGLLSGALFAGLVGRANVAGSPNVFMPTYAVLAVAMPLALQTMLPARPDRGGLKLGSCIAVHLVALAQLAMLTYDPRQAVPSSRDRELSDQVLARLRSIDGGVLIMDDRYFARLLSTPSIGLDYSLVDVLQDKGSPVAAKLQGSIVDALRTRQFAGVVDPHAFILEKLNLGAPVILQSTPFDQRNRFTPKPQAYYPIAQ
jgi:hypothetical protein